jgi:Zn-dependent protease with chaperone function
VAILAYAFTGLVLVPSESTVLVSSGFYSDLPVQAETFIRGSLVVINQVMEELPFLSTTMYTALYYFVFFVPLIITTSLWARHIVSLYQERSSYTDLDSVNTDLTSINVVTVDSEVPVAGPVSTGLGSSSILVSRTVIENLNDDELEAVLRHEEYHIINRDLLANIAASILSVGFGGRNTLLAFFGYPGIEESADKYAVEKTDKQTMLNANKKMYKMSNSLESEDTEIQGLELLWKPLYQFYFGKFLLGTSHRAYAERSKMISDLGE